MQTETHPSSRTIRAALQEASASIGRFEACILLAHVIGRNREFLIAHDDEILSEENSLRFEMLVSLRLAGTPVPYITGRQEFFGRWFTVNEHVLIPRPDTEVLVEQALLVAGPAPRILDLGTGSGCIAATLALELPGADVRATDRSSEALAVARANAEALGAKIEFFEGCWWEALPDARLYDLIVSNPPYIRPDDEHLPALSFEPESALVDPDEGLGAIRTIAAGAMARLAPGGWLLVEHGYDQGADARELFSAAGFAAVHTKKDYGANDRVTLGRRPN